MICTEKEALGIWCSEARVVAADSNGGDAALVFYNRVADRATSAVLLPAAAKCLGSRCMKWEWVDYDFETASEYVGMSHRPNPPGHERAEQRLVDGWEEYESHDKAYRAFKRPTGERRRGTCGLIHRSGE